MVLDYYFLILESSKFCYTDSVLKNQFFFKIYEKQLGPLFFLLDIIIRNNQWKKNIK